MFYCSSMGLGVRTPTLLWSGMVWSHDKVANKLTPKKVQPEMLCHSLKTGLTEASYLLILAWYCGCLQLCRLMKPTSVLIIYCTLVTLKFSAWRIFMKRLHGFPVPSFVSQRKVQIKHPRRCWVGKLMIHNHRCNNLRMISVVLLLIGWATIVSLLCRLSFLTVMQSLLSSSREGMCSAHGFELSFHAVFCNRQ